MDDTLVTAYRLTDYRVHLARGGYASVRIGHPLPTALQTIAGDAWAGIVTAWNPASRPLPTPLNRRAQRRLLADLTKLATTRYLAAAVGVGKDGWREPSLFAVGVEPDILRMLCRRHGQLACVTCPPGQAAELCWADRV